MGSVVLVVLVGLDVVVVGAEDPRNPTSTSISTPLSPLPSPLKARGGIIGGSGFDERYIGYHRVGNLGRGPVLALDAAPAGVDWAVVDADCVGIGIALGTDALRRSRSRSSTSC